jgi:uncharacterized membrane protein YtjA (UPF0391 family)
MTTAGLLLVAGFAVFMAGAAGWKLEYEAPLAERLPQLHEDRRRLRWIHRTMIVALVLTPAGLGAVAAVADHPAAWAAAIAYTVGAVLWIVNLMFRLTVQEWVAEQVDGGSAIPGVFVPLLDWVGLGYTVHMFVAYLSAVPLAWALTERGLIPDWLGWAGAAWGVLFTAGLVYERFRFVFSPPIWAHFFTLGVGIALLV